MKCDVISMWFVNCEKSPSKVKMSLIIPLLSHFFAVSLSNIKTRSLCKFQQLIIDAGPRRWTVEHALPALILLFGLDLDATNEINHKSSKTMFLSLYSMSSMIWEKVRLINLLYKARKYLLTMSHSVSEIGTH